MKRANDAIRNIPAIAMEASLRDRLLGEACFNHAIMHLELAYKYGDQRAGIPISDRDRPENIHVPRQASVADNYAYFAADLIKAAELLPYFSGLGKADYGRAYKTAACPAGALLYLCMNQDGKAKSRHITFGRWFKEAADELEKHDAPQESSTQGFYCSIILKSFDPNKQRFLDAFYFTLEYWGLG